MKRRAENETLHLDWRGHCGSVRVRDDTQDTDMPGRIGNCRDDALSASAASAAAASAAGHLPGRNDGTGWHDLPGSAATATAATAAPQGRRTRLIP